MLARRGQRLGTNWIGLAANEQPWQDHRSSPWYIPLVCVRDDDKTPFAVTPCTLISLSLCNLGFFFDIATSIFPSLLYYIDHAYRLNRYAFDHRMSHSLQILQKSAFRGQDFGDFASYPMKVIVIQGDVDEECVSTCAQMVVKPLVICEAAYQSAVEQAGCLCLNLEGLSAPSLNEAIGQLVNTEPINLEEPGDSNPFLLPYQSVRSHPERHHFASQQEPYPRSTFQAEEPNDKLLNQLVRAIPSGNKTPHRVEDRVSLLISTTQEIFKCKLLDSMLMAAESGNAMIPGELQEDLNELLNTGDRAARQRLMAGIEPYLPSADRSLILCVPCQNKTIPQAYFGKQFPTRVIDILYAAKDRNYIVHSDPRRWHGEAETAAALALTQFLAMESEFFTKMTTLWGLAEKRPVIRVPQISSGFYGKLREIRRVFDGGNIVALNRRVEAFGVELASALPEEFIDLLRDTPRELRIISDMPLEWMMIDGVPLMYRCQVSRFPMTPGNFLLTHYLQTQNVLILDKNAGNRVLILNCLAKTDKLHIYPQKLHEVLQETGITHEYAVVSNLEEYKAQLREKKPFILLHCGHGSYDSAEDLGYLHFGAEKAKVWDLTDTAIPPIVMLGACDTAALAETHNTPSNAFLGLGARAVLATFLAVQADRTIELYVRVLANLDEAISGELGLENWAQVVSKTIILNRYLDFLHAFTQDQIRRRRKEIDSRVFFEYPLRWKRDGFKDFADGYKRCPQLLEDSIRHFDAECADDFHRFVATNKVLMHTMFYTHLGSPETIHIVGEEERRDSEGDSVDYWETRERELSAS